MGISNRDYYRNEGSPPSGFGSGGYGSGGEYSTGSKGWAIKYLLIANIAVFMVDSLMKGGLNEWLSLHRSDLFPSFQIWRVVTYGFCHAGFSHLFFNMIGLWFLGRFVEPIYGSREFLAFFLAGIVVSGLCHILIPDVESIKNGLVVTPPGVIGASGGVMAVVLLTAMHFPRQQVLFMMVIPVELRFLALFYVIGDLTGGFDRGANIAHVAHLGGAAFGAAYKYFDWRVLSWFGFVDRLRLLKSHISRPKVRLYRPESSSDKRRGAPEIDATGPSPDVKQRVDELLDKIHRDGKESLSDRELEFLESASRQYNSGDE